MFKRRLFFYGPDSKVNSGGTAKPTLTGEASADDIKKWKEANPLGVMQVVIDGRVAYFKQPGFGEINFYHSKATASDQIVERWKAFTEITFLGGCEELITSPKYLGSVYEQVTAGMYDFEVTVAKL